MLQGGSRVSRRSLILSAIFLLLGAARAQQDEPVFSTDVKVVSVLATVVDKKGAIIRDLNKDDFALLENGRPQVIRYFSRESDLPLTLGLMVDTSVSQEKEMIAERGASLRFFEQILRPTDQVFLMHFDMAVEMSQSLTHSLRKLEDALAYLDTPSRRQLSQQSGGGTLLYDAVMTASNDVMKKQTGRKALILLTDGVDTGSDSTVQDAIDAALRADTLVYSILFSDPAAYGLFGGGHQGRNVLMRISKETGGSFFEVSKKQSIEQVFDLIQDELRSQYSMGYVSDQPVRISEFRKIALTAKQKGLIVQARDRYWAKR